MFQCSSHSLHFWSANASIATKIISILCLTNKREKINESPRVHGSKAPEKQQEAALRGEETLSF